MSAIAILMVFSCAQAVFADTKWIHPRGFKDVYVREEDAVSHSHGPGGGHAHGGLAFTTWLDLSQAAQQAEAVARSMTRKRPDAKDRIDRNLEALRGDLLKLDDRIAEIARADPGRPLLALHPVYRYLARRYGLNLKSVMWEPNAVRSVRRSLETHIPLLGKPRSAFV